MPPAASSEHLLLSRPRTGPPGRLSTRDIARIGARHAAAWDNWRSRTFRAAAKAAGLRADDDDGSRRVRPRDLRSSFATLLIYEGQPPQYVAEPLGHSAATLLRDYARVWEDFDPSQRVSAKEQIERVRSRLHGAGGAEGAERGVRTRARSASRKGAVFRRCSATSRTGTAPRTTKPRISGGS